MEETQVFVEDQNLNIIKKFEDLIKDANILRGIFNYGWERPSHIQSKAIQPLMEGRDLIAQAQSGTGKSGSFVIGSLLRVDPTIKKPQVLLLSPVHDLAIQTFNLINELTKFIDVKATLVIGRGLHGDYNTYNSREDIPPLDPDAQMVVGTPGRIIDFLKKKKISNEFIKLIILDEADEMLSKGFKDQIKTIFEFLPDDVQVGLFSATMPTSILELSTNFMNDPIRILVHREKLTLDGIQQFYVGVENNDQKFDVLSDLYGRLNLCQTIIFANSKPRVMNLKEKLEAQKFTVSIIHGGMNQYERNDILRDFKLGKSRILISTDILSRGIDIQQISLVINYDIPFSPEKYIHRIGRSGRYGKKGVGINLVTTDDFRMFKAIEKFYHTMILPLPENYYEILKLN